MKRRTSLIFLIAALAAAGVGYVYFGARKDERPDVVTARARFSDIEQTVLANGMLKPIRLVAVGAQVSGRVTSVDVTVGQKVKKGALIAQIDSETQENALRTAIAELADIRAQRQEKEATLTYSETELQRETRTLSQNASSQADYDAAVEAVATTKAQIASLDAGITKAEISVATAKVNLGYTRITAPMSGTVLAVVTQAGQTVNANQTAPTIVILGDLKTMQVQAEISEVDVNKVKPGQEAYFTVLGDPAKRYSVRLKSIYPAPDSIKDDSSFSSSSTSSQASSSSSSSASSEAIYYYGIFEVPNPRGVLRIYMTAEVHIIVGRAKHVLTIPAAALEGPDDRGRYSVELVGPGGQISQRRIKIGLNNNVEAQVLSGLSEGDRVVTSQASAKTEIAGFRRHGPPMGL